MDNASKNRLAKVHPVLADKVAKVIADLAIAGRDVRVVSGLRTYEEQNTLYAQGRTRPGARVTKAKGGQSNHNFGLAVDLCPFENNKPQWNDNPGFNAIGVAGKKHGLDWGGNWKFVDKPHLELKHGLTLAQCRYFYNKGGHYAVWDRVDKNISVAASTSNTIPPVAQDQTTKQPAKPTAPLPEIHLGDRGENVKKLQRALGIKADGIFGKGTLRAVQSVQRKHGLKVDGIVGPKTWDKL